MSGASTLAGVSSRPLTPGAFSTSRQSLPAAPVPRAAPHAPSLDIPSSSSHGSSNCHGTSRASAQRLPPPAATTTLRALCGTLAPQPAAPDSHTALRQTRRQLLPLPRLRRRGAEVAAAAAAATAAPAAVAASAAVGGSSGPLMDLSAVVLGYACLAGSFFRSVPQIAVILRTGSAEGLSLTSNLMELLCFTVSVAYNMQQGYAFNTYGEVFACWIQDVIIVGLIFRHMQLSVGTITASIAAFAACCAMLFSPACPMEVLSALQLSTIGVMAIGARLPQIWLNVRRGNAGVLSPLTCMLNVAGCAVRIFTTAVLTRDAIIMGGCVTQLILNAILLYQSVATPGSHDTATTAASAAATIAATDPPTGGAGEARGQPTGLTSSGANDNGANGSGTAVRPSLLDVAQGKTGGAEGGGGGGGGVPVPAAA